MTDTQEQEIANPVHHDQGTKPGEGLEAYRKMLKATINFEASDLHIKAGTKPRIRVRGVLRSLDAEVNSEPLCYQIAKDILDESQYDHFKKHGQIDLAYDYDEDGEPLILVYGQNDDAALPYTSNPASGIPIMG